MKLRILLALFLFGCATSDGISKDPGKSDPKAPGAGDGASGGNASGTRLKAKWISAEDGAKQFSGFFDVDRGEDCAFDRASDGKMRCMPFGANVNTSFYADASCTKPIAYAYKGCAPPKIATLRDAYCAGTGNSPAKIFAISGPFRGASIYTKGTSNGSPTCNASAASSFDTYDLYTVGAEIAPSQFVAADVSNER